EKLAGCSCHSTCESLQSCCSDINQFCLEISPHSGSLLGGTDFRILNVTFSPDSHLSCRFKSEIVTEGYVDEGGVGHCISPMLFESGWIPFEVSTDGLNYNRVGRWLSVHHSKLSPLYKVVLGNGTQWQYYGTPGVGGVLQMIWIPSLINAERVNIELWGYEETGEYNHSIYNITIPTFRILLILIFTLIMRKNCSSASFSSEGFRRDSAGWALEKCVLWDKEEKIIPSFLPEITDCPCTLAQARADTGRFHVTSVLGDPHFIMFDGTAYTFNGKGEYVLLHSENYNLTVQGRTENMTSENGSSIMATRLCSVAARERDSDVMEVRLTDRLDHLEVLMNQRVLSFSEQSWIDLKGVFVFSAVPQNVTVMFPSGAGLEIRSRGGVMTLTVLLPLEFNDHTLGLLGKMNDDPSDDLTSSDGATLPASASPQDIFTFGASWAISNQSSLFTYDSPRLLNEYYYSPKHDPSFIPVFTITEDPADPLLQPTLLLCSGTGDSAGAQFCKYDALTSRSLELANHTLLSHRSHITTIHQLQPVVSCGWLKPPSHGRKEGTLYLKDAKISFSCDAGYRLHGSEERVCQADGRWSGDETHCVTGNIIFFML
uniref:Sushi domain containing 2 n=1 Tax=Astyanax mexicanus TaxID=7994 RepID=A0A8B9KR96_ASTMX